MVAKLDSERSKSHDDGVLIKKEIIEHYIQNMANTYTQLNAHGVSSVNGSGNFIAGMVHDYLKFTIHTTTSSLQDFCHRAIANNTITACRWHFVRWLTNSK